jgi:beta-lactamase class A
LEETVPKKILLAGLLSRRRFLPWMAAGLCSAAENPLLDEWRQIASETDGTLGAAALNLGTGERAGLNADQRFPMASVCKLPVAAHILAMVDEHRLSLDEEVEIPRRDLWPGVSVVAEKWPAQRRFRLDELVEWMVAQSDNTAVETLYRIGGGGLAVSARLRQWKIAGLRLDRSERQCARDATASIERFLADPRDTATPEGTVQLFQQLFAGELLSAKLTARLVEILKATTTGTARLKGLLPAGTVVAHKTGTTATVAGRNGATNDAGVVLLPGGGQLAVAVYLKGSTRDLPARERAIARVAKAAFDSVPLQ